jgi:hypothetical protein
MNKAEKTQYIIDLERELEQKHVYELFERLTRELIVHQPSNPIEFLIEKLKHPEGRLR